MLRQSSTILSIRTHGMGLHEFTEPVGEFLAETGIGDGLLTLFCRHTSASLLIQENAAPSAQRDIQAFFERIAPENSVYEHDDEGPDDMPAHLRSALTAVQLSIPVQGARMMLGTWQGIFLFEHRQNPLQRQVAIHVIGE